MILRSETQEVLAPDSQQSCRLNKPSSAECSEAMIAGPSWAAHLSNMLTSADALQTLTVVSVKQGVLKHMCSGQHTFCPPDLYAQQCR